MTQTMLKAGALQDAIFNSAYFSSIATDEKGVIAIFNVGAERMLGYAAADVVNLITPADISDPQELIERAAALSLELGTPIAPGFEALVFKATRGIEDIYESTYIRKDGSRFPAIVSTTALRDAEGKIIGYLLIGTDNTVRKQAEADQKKLDQRLADHELYTRSLLQEKNAELEAAKAVAERASLAKSDFLSSMSHELRSPLNAILGFAQLMQTEDPAPSPAQQESIAQILQAGWHLLTLINEILDIAKIESEQVPLSAEPVSLSELLLECQSMMEPLAQARGVSFSIPIEGAWFVGADRTRLKQVLINLISNAIKYNVGGGSVAITCAPGMPGCTRTSVRDTGTGLAPGELSQLFQPFNRLGQEGGGEEGTGIGLVLAKRLVELMGGTIGVESSVGVGSVFWFELRTNSEPIMLRDDVTAVAGQRNVELGAMRAGVLYVEDNPANVKLVEQIIARYPGLRLRTAPNGDAGLESARLERPDVVLLDVNLPGMSGFEVLLRLQADALTAQVPVIAISANAMPFDVDRGLSAGFFRYVTKPIDVPTFVNVLHEALEISKAIVP